MASSPRITTRLLTITQREVARVNLVLRNQFWSGLLVLAAAIIGFVAANSSWSEEFFALRDLQVGPEALHLHLSLGQWSADGLLAVFFFMVGLELKREFVGGALSHFSTAIVPVVAAIGGVAVPALIYLAFNAGGSGARGWAISTATDIAFAITVLGLLAPRIPVALRLFLLTLAVVDDLIAISIIALFYSDGVQWGTLGFALVPLALYAFFAQRGATLFFRHRWAAWVILLPLGALVWALVHASGVHATVAGVLLAFTVPVATKRKNRDGSVRLAPDGSPATFDLAASFGYRFGPLSSGLAVPVFAFFAAGVSLAGEARFPFDPIAIGVLAGLVLGKPLGIVATTWLVTRLPRVSLGEQVSRREMIGIGCLGGVGFTVALLVAELSFTAEADADTARLAVMVASVLAALLAAGFLVRPRRFAR